MRHLCNWYLTKFNIICKFVFCMYYRKMRVFAKVLLDQVESIFWWIKSESSFSKLKHTLYAYSEIKFKMKNYSIRKRIARWYCKQRCKEGNEDRTSVTVVRWVKGFCVPGKKSIAGFEFRGGLKKKQVTWRCRRYTWKEWISNSIHKDFGGAASDFSSVQIRRGVGRQYKWNFQIGMSLNNSSYRDFTSIFPNFFLLSLN